MSLPVKWIKGDDVTDGLHDLCRQGLQTKQMHSVIKASRYNAWLKGKSAVAKNPFRTYKLIIYSTSQKFGHTYSFKGFSLFRLFSTL